MSGVELIGPKKRTGSVSYFGGSKLACSLALLLKGFAALPGRNGYMYMARETRSDSVWR